MMGLEYIVAPLLGGVIGYITNDIAIRMLFRPHTAKYICGMHIPFTPGIIPKEKGRIAEAIGGVISENLMNQEVLQRYLLSDEMLQKVCSSVEGFFEKQKSNDETVEEFLRHYLSHEEINSLLTSATANIAGQVQVKLQDPIVGEQIAHLAMGQVANKLDGNEAEEILAGIGGTLKAVGRNIVGKILNLTMVPIEKFLASNINSMMRNNGATIVSNMISDETNKLLETSVSTLLKGKDDQLLKIASTVKSIYKTTIKDHLPKILQSIDISKIVRERINEMDVNETEKMIFMVMDKELKAIVWLGALLGMVMGSINCFFIELYGNDYFSYERSIFSCYCIQIV